ncbi:unnamed protein product [Dracunculus medinensis]|uniref:PCI domain-containing protein n=1 Tax=Dracunculus medinensis TaxID=318479 RepID=A0A0N4U4K2_DRAME|nr:unnamed protein product [Dracunculus medinensis]
MLFTWIEMAIYLGEWMKVESILAQLQRAITESAETESAVSNASRASRYTATTALVASKVMKDFIANSKAKVVAVSALHSLVTKNYKGCAESCLQIQLENFHYPELLSPKDIACYGTFCSMATFSRNEVKKRVLTNQSFRKFLESEPKLVELLQKFCKSDFAAFFDILEEIRYPLLLDIFFGPRMNELCKMIRHQAIIQYFLPFEAADIVKMSTVFRLSSQELMDELFLLIENDSLRARIDAVNKILVAKKSIRKALILDKILRAGETISYVVLGALCYYDVYTAIRNSEFFRGFVKRGPKLVISSCSGNTVSGHIPLISHFFATRRSISPQAANVQDTEADSLNELYVADDLRESTEISHSAMVSQSAEVTEMHYIANRRNQSTSANLYSSARIRDRD